MPTNVAIDLGFGYVKLALAANSSEEREAECLSFPSIAATSDADFKSLESTGIGQLNVVEVVVDGQRFQIGPDVFSCVSGKDLRVTTNFFFRSDSYRALYLGALAYAMSNSADNIQVDMLVVGLPLTVFQDQSLREDIASWLTGTHELPIPNARGQVRRVTVLQTAVLPQTVGSLYSLASARGATAFDEMGSSTNLLVDVGYGTMMWMVSQGLTPSMARSGANMGGAHTGLNKVLRSIAPQLEDKPFALERLDTRLRELLGSPLTASLDSLESLSPDAFQRVIREDVDPAKVSTAVRTATRQYVSEMLSKVDDLAAIDNVWLTGGACHLYSAEVRGVFPKHQLMIDSGDPRYSNLRGFYLIGRRALAAE